MPVEGSFSTAPQAPHHAGRPAGLSRSLALRATGALLVAAALSAGVATLMDSGGAAATPRERTAVEPATVPAGEAAAFAVLRRPRTAADSFAQIRSGAGPFGANPALARTVLAPARPAALEPRLVSLVPAAGGVCLRLLELAGDARWWCAPTAQAARGRLVVALLAGGPAPLARSRQFVIGLVPDGVASVTIDGADGAGHKVAVESNVYATTVFDPTEITFSLPGRRTVSDRVRD